MTISLIKCHGSSNDFIIFDEQQVQSNLTDESRAELAKVLCQRTTSIGADGILFISQSSKAQAKMRVFNADGSEASMCGNGLRCAARYLSERDQLTKFKVETMKAILSVEKVEPIYEDIPTFAVEISPVLFDLKALPLMMEQDQLINQIVPEWHSALRFSALAVPNPHLITQVSPDVLASDVQQTIAQKFNSANEWFPDGVNVSFVVSLSSNEIFVRTYERGVGFTNACGTAMSSSSLVQVLLGSTEPDTPIDVYNDGGRVKCVIHKKGNEYDHIDLVGNATFTDYYQLEINDLSDVKLNTIHEKKTDEETTYQKMAQAAKEHVNSIFPNIIG